MSDTDDPFRPASDVTVVRPRPGAGRRRVDRAERVDEPPTVVADGHRREPPRPPGVVAGEAGRSEPERRRRDARPQPPGDRLPEGSVGAGPGGSPLVRAATPLLLLAGHVRTMGTGPDVGRLRRHALEEIRRFEEATREAGVTKEVAVAARYALCAALDEAVLSTPWGAHSEWAQQTLLIDFHRDASGGEKFFDMLQRISKDPGRHLDLIELQYLCLAFGFAGRYQLAERGHARLADMQQELYRAIREQRGVPSSDLSLRWGPVPQVRHRLIEYVPWWAVAGGAFGIVAVVFAFYTAWLGSAVTPVYDALRQAGRLTPGPVVAAAGPTLREALTLEGAVSPALRVEDRGGRTVLTLSAADLFRSARAEPGEAYGDLLRRIGLALRRVPGPVEVVGHTDKQPLRSLTFADNEELSRARAREVARVLGEVTGQPDRFQAIGAGALEPLHDPETLPEHRALNRRVEIVHVPGA